MDHRLSSQQAKEQTEIAEKINEFLKEFVDFEEKIELQIVVSVKHFLFRIYIIFYYCIKALDPGKAENFFKNHQHKFELGGKYHLASNEEILNVISTNMDDENDKYCTTDFYDKIYDSKITMSDDIWKIIFGIIRTNKARNIHATIIDFPILQQNLNLVVEKLLDYSDDRVRDMSLMKYVVSGTYNKMICCEISMSGYIVAIGFEDGLIKVFKCKIGPKLRGAPASGMMTHGDIGYSQKPEVSETTDKLYGHEGAVYCLSLSHDEKLLVSGSADSTIRLWCVPKGECLILYKAHQFAVWDIKFFSFSNFFASGSADALAKMWTISKLEPVRIFCYHVVDVVKVEFVPKYKSLVTASVDFTMVIWNIIKGQKMIVIESGNSPIRSLIVTKSCRYLITGNENGNLCIFDLNFKCINILNIKHSDKKAIWSIDFDQFYNFLAIGDESNIITVYNFKELCKEATINPSLDERQVPENCVIHRIKASEHKENKVYGLRYTHNNIIVSVIEKVV